MARTCRFPFHHGPFRAAFLALLLIACASSAAKAITKAEHLYLLTATPTMDNSSFPANLYTVTAGHELRLVRNIVPTQDGTFDVLDDLGDKIYVLYPHSSRTTVSVIHKDGPTKIDKVTVNVKLYGWRMGVSAGPGLQSYLLIPFTFPDGLLSVAGDVSANVPRVASGQWNEYRSFRYEGFAGGPGLCWYSPLMTLTPHEVVMRMFMGSAKNQVELNPASPDMRVPEGRPWWPVQIIAASRRFFAFDVPPPGVGGTFAIPLHVYDRKLRLWRVLNLPATNPRSRIFGDWLATIVVNYVVKNGAHSGRQNERDRSTVLLPDVRKEYSGCGKHCSIPGTLILDNLSDGRRITLQTKQEDSEIVDVGRDGLVLYRVNDSIFSAHIEGDKVSAPTLVVKGEDVPEVHWAFWSKAGTEPHSTAHTSSNH